jgi:hypothetical protein
MLPYILPKAEYDDGYLIGSIRKTRIMAYVRISELRVIIISETYSEKYIGPVTEPVSVTVIDRASGSARNRASDRASDRASVSDNDRQSYMAVSETESVPEQGRMTLSL